VARPNCPSCANRLRQCWIDGRGSLPTIPLARWTRVRIISSSVERRADILVGRGSKKALITTFIDSLFADEFTVSAVRQAAPGVSDAYISKVLGELKKAGVLEPLGTGRGAR
jgi:hypothetical protein